MEGIYDMIVAGAGPAGCTAALYGARAGLSVLLLEQFSAGGQMALTARVENYPGFDEGIDGFELGERMLRQALDVGADLKTAQILSAQLGGQVKEFLTDAGIFRGRCAVIAAGASARRLNLPRESELSGRGVHYCVACDGMAYRDKTTAVVGGGNSAVHDALELSRICGQVLLIHRRDTLRADRIYDAALAGAKNISFLWNSAVTGLSGSERLTGIQVKDLKTGQIHPIACDGLFVSIGRAPDTAAFSGSLNLDAGGYIIADETTRTNLPGVFAAGDIRTKALRQIVTAVSDGAMSAHFAGEYLAETK